MQLWGFGNLGSRPVQTEHSYRSSTTEGVYLVLTSRTHDGVFLAKEDDDTQGIVP